MVLSVRSESLPTALPLRLPSEYLDEARRLFPNELDGVGGARYNIPFDVGEIGVALQVVGVPSKLSSIAMLPNTVRRLIEHFVAWAIRHHKNYVLELKSPSGDVSFKIEHGADAAAIAKAAIDTL